MLIHRGHLVLEGNLRHQAFHGALFCASQWKGGVIFGGYPGLTLLAERLIILSFVSNLGSIKSDSAQAAGAGQVIRFGGRTISASDLCGKGGGWGMRMIFVLARRDFMSRVKSGPYIITTLLGMLVFIGLSFAPLLLDYFASAFDEQPLDFIVVDYSGEFFPFLAEVVAENEPGGVIEEIQPGGESEAFQRVIDEGKLGLLLVDLPEFAFAALDGSNYVSISRREYR